MGNPNIPKGQIWSMAMSLLWPASPVWDEASGDQNLLLGPSSECVTSDKSLLQSPHRCSGGWVRITSQTCTRKLLETPDGRSEAAVALNVLQWQQ